MLVVVDIGNTNITIGIYKEDKLIPLYIQTISCSFKIKKNKIPTIQIKQKI